MKVTILSLLLFSIVFLMYVSAFRSPHLIIKTARTTNYIEISKRNNIPVEDRRVVYKSLVVVFLTFLFTKMSNDYIILAAPSAVIHYDIYCGPGPDRSVNTEPVDGFDSICKDHDIDYSLCQPEILHIQVSASKEKSFPTFINQLISIRGKLPSSITNKISSIYPLYTQCIHRADAKFVHKLRALKVNDIKSREGIPITESRVFQQPSTASTAGGNICLLGYKYGQSYDCLISSYSFFTTFAMDLFSSDLEADAHHLNF